LILTTTASARRSTRCMSSGPRGDVHAVVCHLDMYALLSRCQYAAVFLTRWSSGISALSAALGETSPRNRSLKLKHCTNPPLLHLRRSELDPMSSSHSPFTTSSHAQVGDMWTSTDLAYTSIIPSWECTTWFGKKRLLLIQMRRDFP
jgi:hypothetical protein